MAGGGRDLPEALRRPAEAADPDPVVAAARVLVQEAQARRDAAAG
jgi:hypothetical protein